MHWWKQHPPGWYAWDRWYEDDDEGGGDGDDDEEDDDSGDDSGGDDSGGDDSGGDDSGGDDSGGDDSGGDDSGDRGRGWSPDDDPDLDSDGDSGDDNAIQREWARDQQEREQERDQSWERDRQDREREDQQREFERQREEQEQQRQRDEQQRQEDEQRRQQVAEQARLAQAYRTQDAGLTGVNFDPLYGGGQRGEVPEPPQPGDVATPPPAYVILHHKTTGEDVRITPDQLQYVTNLDEFDPPQPDQASSPLQLQPSDAEAAELRHAGNATAATGRLIQGALNQSPGPRPEESGGSPAPQTAVNQPGSLFAPAQPQEQQPAPPPNGTAPETAAQNAAVAAAATGADAATVAATAEMAARIASDRQTLGQQSGWTQAIFRSEYKDQAEQQWVLQHEAELDRNQRLYGYREPGINQAPRSDAPAGTPLAPNRTIGAVRPPGVGETAQYGQAPSRVLGATAVAAQTATAGPAAATPANALGLGAIGATPAPNTAPAQPAAPGAPAVAGAPPTTGWNPIPGQGPPRAPSAPSTLPGLTPPVKLDPNTAAGEPGGPALTTEYPILPNPHGDLPPPTAGEPGGPPLATGSSVAVNPFTPGSMIEATGPDGKTYTFTPDEWAQADPEVRNEYSGVRIVPGSTAPSASPAATAPDGLPPLSNVPLEGPKPGDATVTFQDQWGNQHTLTEADFNARPGGNADVTVISRGVAPGPAAAVEAPTGAIIAATGPDDQIYHFTQDEWAQADAETKNFYRDAHLIPVGGEGGQRGGDLTALPAPTIVRSLDQLSRSTAPLDALASLGLFNKGEEPTAEAIRRDAYNISHGISAMFAGDSRVTWPEPYLNDVARMAWVREEAQNGRASDPRDAPVQYVELWKDGFYGSDERIPLVKELNQQMIDYGASRTPPGGPFNWQAVYGPTGKNGLIQRQQTQVDCGPNAVATILRSRGYNADGYAVFDYAIDNKYHTAQRRPGVPPRTPNSYTDGMWTGPQQMVNILKNDAGLDAKAISINQNGAGWDQIDQELAEGRPVLISSIGHYWSVSAKDPTTGKYYVGGSKLSINDEWMPRGAFKYSGDPGDAGWANTAVLTRGDVAPDSKIVRSMGLKPPESAPRSTRGFLSGQTDLGTGSAPAARSQEAPAPSAEPDRTSMPKSYGRPIEARVYDAAVKAGHPDPVEFVEQMRHESRNFDPIVLDGSDPNKARGIAQIMPDVAAAAKVNPLNIDQALAYAAKRMTDNYKTYDGNQEMALAEYNMGAGNLKRYGPRGLDETNKYIDIIRGLKVKAWNGGQRGGDPVPFPEDTQGRNPNSGFVYDEAIDNSRYGSPRGGGLQVQLDENGQVIDDTRFIPGPPLKIRYDVWGNEHEERDIPEWWPGKPFPSPSGPHAMQDETTSQETDTLAPVNGRYEKLSLPERTGGAYAYGGAEAPTYQDDQREAAVVPPAPPEAYPFANDPRVQQAISEDIWSPNQPARQSLMQDYQKLPMEQRQALFDRAMDEGLAAERITGAEAERWKRAMYEIATGTGRLQGVQGENPALNPYMIAGEHRGNPVYAGEVLPSSATGYFQMIQTHRNGKDFGFKGYVPKEYNGDIYNPIAQVRQMVRTIKASSNFRGNPDAAVADKKSKGHWDLIVQAREPY